MKASRFITREQMEALTEQILEEYGYDPRGKIIQPVPIEELVEFHFDLQICWETIDHLDAGGIVMAALLPDQRQIILNESRRDLFDSKLGTYHFTLAHELGHWVLHSGESPAILRLRGAEQNRSSKPAEEVQADLFAGCLLLPEPMLVRAVDQLKRMGRIHLSNLYALADCFQVSISALSVRLTQLHLLHIDSAGYVSQPAPADRKGRLEQLTLDI
ncbi:ImmA/IrrE family metallo-endopeptidase [Paenibacillus spongiae]|uniref:ImmA/IrrE family metallo-endopeptidase n=1 Tax=Paenibacillus spongiae TaxID=2909671 RepID=A0ABY5S635_9BACL|nr:ImmA/IrrE family metallo-endopeptidase [Paenibacillus spongiae]UVI29045.1 ImmA/IrrE family metallo-endopeptidase [Paenibacillus spongiae]